MVRLTKGVFKEAVKDTGGIVSQIAKNAGVANKTVYDFLARHPEMKKVREVEIEKVLDMAEGNLFLKARDKNEWAIKYLLSHKGRLRGYADKTEVEHSGKIGITEIKVVMANESGVPPDMQTVSGVQETN